MPDDTGEFIRDAARDLTYRLPTERAVAKAQALTEVHRLAEAAGASAEQLDQITEGFTQIAQELIAEQSPKRRRALRPRRARAGRALPSAEHPGLPPGT